MYLKLTIHGAILSCLYSNFCLVSSSSSSNNFCLNIFYCTADLLLKNCLRFHFSERIFIFSSFERSFCWIYNFWLAIFFPYHKDVSPWSHLHGFWKHVFFLWLNLFIYFWLCWVFVAVYRLSLVAMSGNYSSLWCLGFLLQWLLLLQSTDSSVWASVITAYRLSSCCIKALEHGL